VPRAERDIDLPHSFEHSYTAAEYPTDENYERPEVARKYADYSRAMWDEQEEFMRTLHQVWTQNLLFLSGRQWWTTGRDGVVKPQRVASWREQPVANLTLAYFRNFLAKATKVRPAWTVIPASTDPEDVHAAELGDTVLEAKWEELRLGRILRVAISWTIATGNGFLYPYWNDNTGKMVPLEAEIDIPIYDDETGAMVGMEPATVLLDEDGEPQLLEDGSPDPDAEPVMIDEGDFAVKAYSPFQVRVNPEAESDDDATVYMIAEVTSMREAGVKWPEKVKDLVPEDLSEAAEYERAVVGLGGMMGDPSSQLSPTEGRDQHLDRVLVIHHHEKPTADYPDGRYWVSGSGGVLLEDPQPLPEGIWPPVIHLEDVYVPGRYHASSVMEQIIPLNKHYNELNALIKEHHNLFARGKWLTPKGSGIKKGAITNQPGEVITYNPGFKPEQADIRNLPSSVYEERSRVLNDYELVGGIHKISMGRPPPGVTAGVAFMQLQEADDTDMGPFLAMLEESVAAMARAALRIIRERYTTERLIYAAGDDRRYQVRAFHGSELEGAIDVRAQTGSSFPWSRTARQSMLLSLAAQMPQLFQDAETGQFDTAKFARLLPVGGLGSIGNMNDLDVQEAEREEEVFSTYGEETNEIPQVEFWQNHDVHYNQHIRVLKSSSFRDWNEQAQQAFLQHVQETQQARQQKAQESAQMNAMAQGNAPKELYGQGGIPGPSEAEAANMSEDELAALAEEELAGMENHEGPEWVEGQMATLPPNPAEPGGMNIPGPAI